MRGRLYAAFSALFRMKSAKLMKVLSSIFRSRYLPVSGASAQRFASSARLAARAARWLSVTRRPSFLM